jgi:acylphosphatase
MEIMRKLIAHVSGKVQMAGYRAKVVTIAKAFDLKGYVRNLPDGRVKVLAEGSDADLQRFLKAIMIENTLIKVDDVQIEFSDALGAYDDFFKVAGENETDARLDVAAEHLKELIMVAREGFKENNALLQEFSAKQDYVIDAIDDVREDVVSEVQGLRSDLKGRMDERLQRIESDVVDIKARIRP